MVGTVLWGDEEASDRTGKELALPPIDAAAFGKNQSTVTMEGEASRFGRLTQTVGNNLLLATKTGVMAEPQGVKMKALTASIVVAVQRKETGV